MSSRSHRASPPPPPPPSPPRAVPRGLAAGVKVRATHVGYYDDARRRVGDVFRLVKPEDFSPTWMALESHPSVPEHTTSGPAHLAQQNAHAIDSKRRGGPALEGPTGAYDPLGDDA